jgi:secondary thiamine-phosphate synthase enzyme
MPTTSRSSSGVRARVLTFATHQPIQLVDITDAVAACVRQARLQDGLVHVFSRHTTAAVRIQEDEPLLLGDLRRFLARLAPPNADYGHNDFRVRTQHMHPDERPNGHAHCLQLLLGSSESVPVVDGKLLLGTWQRLFLVELDGPRPERQVLVQLVGEAQPAPDWTPPAARVRQRHVELALMALRRRPAPNRRAERAAGPAGAPLDRLSMMCP